MCEAEHLLLVSDYILSSGCHGVLGLCLVILNEWCHWILVFRYSLGYSISYSYMSKCDIFHYDWYTCTMTRTCFWGNKLIWRKRYSSTHPKLEHSLHIKTDNQIYKVLSKEIKMFLQYISLIDLLSVHKQHMSILKKNKVSDKWNVQWNSRVQQDPAFNKVKFSRCGS